MPFFHSLSSTPRTQSSSDYQRQVIAQKLSQFKRIDPLRDYVEPVSAMEKAEEKQRATPGYRATDNLGASTQKIKRKPLPDVVPAKRSKDVVHDTRKHTPTASHSSDETCELRRRGTVRVHADLSKRVPADVGAVPSALDEVERRAREVRRIAVVLEK
jgi:hypothetical protein